ncbi:hypothetical protein FJR11_00110 [Anabaena sp. UHCC 0187]|uniref:hypothetical protein n=1 Tax=Anabaena sp. UHCC 0187 TaxID=2590018 RepID=UPI00144613DE|nr:hypothetical protein [Anabaena sp. UHCC 0187]MDP5017455.1 hypothetical protein [Dolichospermum sp.]MTJ11026.1 hypothetical protein [Anabaena sp. UHCC 0187]
MSELRYYRRVDNLATWAIGKGQKGILSPEHTEKYLKDIKGGNGFPSLWLPSSPEDLEKISLGMSLLRKKSIENVRLLGFNECCFTNTGIEVKQVKDDNFPIPTVAHLHYELCTLDDNKLIEAIKIFIQCNGVFEEFSKAKEDPNKSNMRQIAAKYIDQVSEQYKQTTQEWGEKYL